MKKLLTLILSLVIGLGCMVSFVACGKKTEDSNDADIAKRAIESIKSMYETKNKEERSDYSVVGQIKVDNEAYAIVWTSDKENAKVGKMDETTKLVTISITPAAEVIEYKLTASVTVGEATESYAFNRKILAAVAEGNGTFDAPFSVTQVFEIVEKLENEKFYDGATEGGVAKDAVNAEANRYYIKGFVVDPGHTYDGVSYKYQGGVQYVYIADDFSEEMNSYSDGAISIASLTYDEAKGIFTKDKLLEKGEEIIVSGYIERFKDKPSIYYITGQNIFCEWRSGEGKAPEADSPVVDPTDSYGSKEAPLSVTEALALATEQCVNSNDVTDKVVYATGTVKSVGSIGSYYSNVVITDLANSSTEILIYSMNKTTGVADPVVGDVIVLYGYIKNYNGTIEFASANNQYPVIVSNNEAGEREPSGGGDEAPEGTLQATLAYAGSATGNMTGGNDAATLGADASIFNIYSTKTGNNHIGLNKAGNLRFYYNGSATLHIEISNAYIIESIAVTLANGSPSGLDMLAVEVEGQRVTGADGVYAINGTSVSLYNANTANSQIYVESIKINYKEADGSVHVHEWEYVHNADTMTHTGTCQAAGCDVNTRTVDCVPENNICPDCKHSYNETEILTALKALASGQSLKGTFVLTGVVTDTPSAGTSGDLKFNMDVNGTTIYAYYVKPGSFTVKQGDTVTVSGPLKNFNNTLEFDNGNITAVVAGEGGGGTGGDQNTDPTDQPVVYVAADQGYTASAALPNDKLTWVNGDVSIAFNKGTAGTAPSYYTSSPAGVRVYGGGYFTVSVPSGCTITKIVITSQAKATNNALSADVGDLAGTTATSVYTSTWTGTAESIKFTVGNTSGNNGIQKIEVYYTAA